MDGPLGNCIDLLNETLLHKKISWKHTSLTCIPSISFSLDLCLFGFATKSFASTLWHDAVKKEKKGDKILHFSFH